MRAGGAAAAGPIRPATMVRTAAPRHIKSHWTRRREMCNALKSRAAWPYRRDSRRPSPPSGAFPNDPGMISPSLSDSMVLLDDVHLTLASAAGAVNVLRGISLAIAPGETVSVVGPSGSGKSTMMMIVGGLERPSGGRVVVAGNDLGALDEDGLARFRRDHVGIVFQSFHLVPTMNALENVAIPLELAGRRDAFARAEGRARGGRARPSPAALSRPALRRRAAACRARPRLRGNAEAAPRRRADRQSRYGDRAGRHRPAVHAPGAPRHDARAHHARSEPRATLRPHRSASPTAGSSTTGRGAPPCGRYDGAGGMILPLALRLARREMRGGLRGFGIFLACLTLGVAAIAGVGSLAAAVNAGLKGDARMVLGGDVEFHFVNREATPVQRAAIGEQRHGLGDRRVARDGAHRGRQPAQSHRAEGGRRAPIRSTARSSSRRRWGWTRHLPRRDGRWGAAVDASLLTRLGLKLGDTIRVGEGDIRSFAPY